MKLNINRRSAAAKKEAKRLRRDGDIPAVLYGVGKQAENITVSAAEFETVLRQIKSGALPTVVFSLSLDGKETQALLKDIQYDKTSYRVIHLDFEILDEKVPVNVNVPIYCTDVAACAGIKLGGQLRQVIRHVAVRCLPKDLPKEFLLSVKSLGIKQSKRLKDLVVPEGVKLLAPLNEVAVVIAKR